jgi:uncharacterized membrane protein YraQ (UPF0718 family)
MKNIKLKDVQSVISGNSIFLAVIVVGYIITAFIKPVIVVEALIGFLDLLEKVIPILFFVFALIFAFNLFINPKVVAKYLGTERGFTGWLVSIVGGIISMGAIYMWYPLLKDLREKGMKDSLIVAFLYNRSIKIPLLPFLVHYFGFVFTVVITLYTIIFSIINGFLVDKILSPKKIKNKKT